MLKKEEKCNLNNYNEKTPISAVEPSNKFHLQLSETEYNQLEFVAIKAELEMKEDPLNDCKTQIDPLFDLSIEPKDISSGNHSISSKSIILKEELIVKDEWGITGAANTYLQQSDQLINNHFEAQNNILLNSNIKTENDNICVANGSPAVIEESNFMEYENTELNQDKEQTIASDKKHTNNDQFKCEECEYNASTPSNLVQHIRIHTDDTVQKCQECYYSTYQRDNLLVHTKTHLGARPYTCTLCDYCSSTEVDLVVHVKTHANEEPFKCGICNFIALSPLKLIYHIAIHTTMHSCNFCSYTTIDKCDMFIHSRIHTREVPFFKCELCEYSGVSMTRLTDHVKMHGNSRKKRKKQACKQTDIKEDILKCSLCEFGAVENEGLLEHLKMHPNVNLFRCTKCDYSTTTIGSLTLHINTHISE